MIEKAKSVIHKFAPGLKKYQAIMDGLQMDQAKVIIVRSPTEFEKNKVILNMLEYDVYRQLKSL